MRAPPRWMRTLRSLDAQVQRAARASLALHDALVCAWTPPAQRAALTAWSYDQQPTYARGGSTFERGLMPWEKALVSHPRFASARRVLVGGAGGGREALALLERGHSVVAFEPSPRLVADARAVLEPAGGAVLQGSYEDLVRAVRERRGGLAGLASLGPFDAVLLGWGSLSHVCEADARSELFAALRVLAPGAPVALSYLYRASPADGHGGSRQLRERALRWSRRLGARGALTPGLRYLPHAGFAAALEDHELDALARLAGLAVSVRESQPYPHALLLPADEAR